VFKDGGEGKLRNTEILNLTVIIQTNEITLQGYKMNRMYVRR